MPEIENSNFLDTNIVFDIIYSKRERHNIAINFYTNFKNYELLIENTVLLECTEIILNSFSLFIIKFLDFLNFKKNKGILWDNLIYDKKLDILKEFQEDSQKNQEISYYKEFIYDITEELKNDLIILNMEDIKNFLIEIPAYMAKELKKQISAHFKIVIPASGLDIIIEVIKTIKEIINNDPLFKKKQSRDRDIFINLIIIGSFGDIDNNSYKKINFYTADNDFKKLSSNFHQLFSNYYNHKNLTNDDVDIKKRIESGYSIINFKDLSEPK